MKNMVSKSLLSLSAALGILAFISACNKPFELDYPLNISQNKLILKKGGGSTHIFVYSTGQWTARFIEPVVWASMDRTEGYGNTDFIFDYAPNYGIAREVKIELSMAENKDTISIVQNGAITNVSFIPYYKSIILVRQAATASISYTSNVLYGMEVMKGSVQYEDEFADPWIDNVRVEGGNVLFDVLENPEPMSRKAWITLTLPDCTGASTYLMTSRLAISQTKDDPALSFKQTSVSLDAAAQNVVVQTSRNNVWPYLSSLKTEVVVNTEKNDWLTGVMLTQDGLQFAVSVNNTGKIRSGNIVISFQTADGQKVSATCSVSQSSSL